MTEQETIELSQVDELQERLALIEKERDSLQAMVEKDEPLHPYQVELLKLQRHIEVERIPMIVLFEGRDASGKGGTIRRVMRYMNDKRVRAVALGKPTEEQTTQWYVQRYVTQIATAINNANLAETLVGLGHEIDKKFIKVEGGNIKRLGKYNATIRLHRAVLVDLTFDVIAEGK